MLAWVFYMQPLGYLLAAVVTLAVTRQYRNSIPIDVSDGNCDAECIRALDRCWRTIIGVGAVPALIAVFFRRSIPESPLYTADVINQPLGAKEDFVLLSGRNSTAQVHEDGNPGAGIELADNSTAGSETAEYYEPPPIPMLADDPGTEDDANEFSYRWKTYWQSFSTHFFQKGYWRSLLGVSFAWLMVDTSFYALGSNSSTILTIIFSSIPLGTNIDCTILADNLQNCTVLDPLAQNPDA